MKKLSVFGKKLISKSFEYSIHLSIIALAIAVIFGDLFLLSQYPGSTARADVAVASPVDVRKVDAVFAHINRLVSPLNAGGAIEAKGLLSDSNIFLDKPMLLGTIVSDLAREKVTTYTVLEGDTYWTIAYKFEISIDTLMWANNIDNLNNIKVGEKLTILPVNGLLHIVKDNETLNDVANFYGVSRDTIVSQNKLEIASVTSGQQLVIPGAKRFSTNTVRLPVIGQGVEEYHGSITPGTGIFKWPVITDENYISQYFGWVTNWYKHTGIDMDSRNGLDILASDKGTVVAIGTGWSGGYGNHIVIDHGNGYQTLYAHLSSFLVNVGQTVEQGDKIAIMGTTGRSTGVHLHFEIRYDGKAINPIAYLK